jgi:response regulator RpfG family c-di-GMP phosphodiesterase
MVRSQSGRHFDPDVVEAFFAAEAEIRAIREGQHPEPPAGQ